jgi:hypothetical protein
MRMDPFREARDLPALRASKLSTQPSRRVSGQFLYRAGTGHIGTGPAGSVPVLMRSGPDTAPEEPRVEGPQSNVRGRSGPDTSRGSGLEVRTLVGTGDGTWGQGPDCKVRTLSFGTSGLEQDSGPDSQSGPVSKSGPILTIPKWSGRSRWRAIT